MWMALARVAHVGVAPAIQIALTELVVNVAIANVVTGARNGTNNW